MLYLSQISKTYIHSKTSERIEVLDNVTFEIEDEKITVVVGESGCGKTTLLNIISQLDQDFSGSVNFDKENSHKIGYLFQTPSLIPWRTVWDNIVIGCEIQKLEAISYKEQADNFLKRYNLAEFASAYPNFLSQGMQQRVSLIRLLMYGARILLLDEAFSRLDPIFRAALYRDVSDLVREKRKTVVLVTHDVEEAVTLADKVVVLSPRPGQVITEIEIPIEHSARLASPLGQSDLLLPYFRELWDALRTVSNSNR
jgi:NitT/TauT family transport system ATP-binding protein